MTTAPSALLELRDVHRHFSRRGSTVRAVDGVTLTIGRGETLGLVGESGCGKSTLGRVSIALQPVTEGQVLLEGEDLASLSREKLRQRRKRMQMVFQDPVSSLNPRMSVGKIIAEPLAELGVVEDRAARAARVQELQDMVGLSRAYADRHPSELSGGQAQRVAIARALAVEPALVVADEAISSLDVSIGAQILNLLDDLRRELSLSYLFISHDLHVVEHICDRVAVMYLGKVVETALSTDVFGNPRHPYTLALLSAAPTPDLVEKRPRERIILRGDPPNPADPPSGCRFHTRCPIGPLAHPQRSVCKEKEPQLTEVRPGHATACHFADELAGAQRSL